MKWGYKMTKRIFLFVSLFILSEDSIGLQTLLKGGSEQFFSRSLHSASRRYQSPKRFFSSTPLNDQIPVSGVSNSMQVFTRPTYDRIAKYVLSEDESVRVDILRAFTGISTLSSATQLDEHYNPFDPLHNLRKLINSTSSKNLFETIRDSSTMEPSIDGKKNNKAPEILRGLK
jgi:hypothetical protein